MLISFPTQVSLAKSIISLTESCEGRIDELSDIVDICQAMSECAEDEHSLIYDLLEYVQESQRIAEGEGDRVWRQQLYETLLDDMESDIE